MEDQQLKTYHVWDKSVRFFHWINVICVLCLLALGLIILNSGMFGIPNEGKVLLKELHVIVGYVLALNLLWRVIWGFIGSKYARWSAVLPFKKGLGNDISEFRQGLSNGKPVHYKGHNPLARIGISLLFLLLISQTITGLVLAGTDVYYPPLGNWIAEWIAAEGVNPADLIPYSPDLYDPEAYKEMREFRSPYLWVHLNGFYALCVLAVIHIAAVIYEENKIGGGMISAMFTGKKALPEKPVDDE